MKKWIVATIVGLSAAIASVMIATAATYYVTTDSASLALVFLATLLAVPVLCLSFMLGFFVFLFTASRF